MIFRECSIGGKVYSGDAPEDAPPLHSNHTPPGPRPSSGGSSTVVESNSGVANTASEGRATPPRPSSPAPRPRFVDAVLTADLVAAQHTGADAPPAARAHARALHGFFSVLALCHTVLADTDADGNVVAYKAQSPDEAALVQAAADAGYVFRGREREVLLLQTPSCAPGAVERYELLNILEFTSARKRMSVVVRKVKEGGTGDGDGDGRLLLLSKGADNVIFERLKKGVDAGEVLRGETEKQLDEFAGEGLRTLTLAYKVLQGALCLRFGCESLLTDAE